MITRQDIIDMANGAENIDQLVNFGEAVATKERNYWKEIIEGQRNCIRALNDIVGGEGSTTTANILDYSRWEERVQAAIEREREACAKRVEFLGLMRQLWSPKQMAEAIRNKA